MISRERVRDDRERVGLLTVKPPGKDETQRSIDANLKVRIPVKAGPHKLGVTFVKKGSSLLETTRQPLNVHFNYYRHPRLGPAIYEVSIVGPYNAGGPGNTPSRRRIFTSRPTGPDDEEACAKRILGSLVRGAYRRPITDEDLKEATNAAHQIGDDTLGHSDTSQFTHGSSEQRMRWFKRGFSGGDPRQCDTFGVAKAEL